MANTYTQLYFHVVLVVKKRAKLINSNLKDELYKFISGVIKNRGQKLMKINGMPDHVHLFISTKPDCNLSELMRDIKSSSSKWINKNKLTQNPFRWQKGFAAFTKGKSQVDVVINYIKNQEIHHRKKSLEEEYVEFLLEYEVDYKDEYLFD